MFGLGLQELIIILVIVVLLFGASRLPQIGSGIGEGIRNFKKSMKDSQSEKDGKSDKKEVDVTPRGDDDDRK